MRQPPSLATQIGDLLARDGAMSLSRVAIGGILGGVIAAGITLPAALLTVGVLIGATALANMGIERSRKRLLLETYREEIAATLGKDPDDVHVSDLQEMSRTPDQGGRGSYAIRDALSYFADSRNFHIVAQAVTAGIMTTGLLALELAFPNSSALVFAGGSALVYNEVFDTVSDVGRVLEKDKLKGTITREVRAINEQIDLGGRVSSTRVFGVFVEADPALKKEIVQKFGDEYADLSIAKKREAVALYNDRYGLYSLTQDINRGNVKPKELAFLAYGQHSGVPRREATVPPFEQIGDESVCYGIPQARGEQQSRARNPALPEAGRDELPGRLFQDLVTSSENEPGVFDRVH